ncbi:putative ABC transport system ATP-binding protein [Luteibacter sp. Sphag1AF]|uniref:ABC transporter ATP-binding protein n=1 Tax=Luteibacter sp. Sphag1AF TaxID=2587031 RepID=UPI001614EBEE|nr:ABC transporter ATP-binding protein [Luteibacter sp. Sphag1AF]MBB3228714.1 putative ABC transport system ATP-binding protein [Luteibacter sp. Sphag1AF]
MNNIVQIRDLGKNYQKGPTTVQVLSGLDLDIEKGEFVALVGPSGSGKTTLLNIIGGIDAPSSGSVAFDGREVNYGDDGRLARWRAEHVGFVFQFYHLLPMLSAMRNVELPLLLTRMGAAERQQRCVLALGLVGLSDRAGHRPAELSGGEQQRVAIARAIVSDPGLLVCDEPTGDLDRESSTQILQLLRDLNGQHGKTIVMVTHDPYAAAFADRTVSMEKGKLQVA